MKEVKHFTKALEAAETKKPDEAVVEESAPKEETPADALPEEQTSPTYVGVDGAVAKLREEIKKANNTFAESVLNHVIDRCSQSQSLAESICQEHKTWSRCNAYIRKKVEEMRKGNELVVAVEDHFVYEWAEDYYWLDDKAILEEEEQKKREAALKQKELEEKRKARKKTTKKTTKKKTEKAKPAPKASETEKAATVKAEPAPESSTEIPSWLLDDSEPAPESSTEIPEWLMDNPKPQESQTPEDDPFAGQMNIFDFI